MLTSQARPASRVAVSASCLAALLAAGVSLADNGPCTILGGDHLETSNATMDAVAADADGDGDTDVVLGSFVDGGVSILWNNGPEGYEALTVGDDTSAISVGIGDLDDDGVTDLVAADWSEGLVRVYPYVASGLFGAPASYPLTIDHPQCLVLADLDGDGATDVAVVSSDGTSILLNDGSGALVEDAVYGFAGSWTIDAGDVDGDGDVDLVVNDARVLRNDGFGAFTDGGAFASSPTGGAHRPLRLGDLDGDGALDVVHATDDHRIEVLLGAGDGTFTSDAAYPTDTLSLTLGDVDGDGDLDVAAVQFNGDENLVLLLNDGLGHLEAVSTIDQGALFLNSVAMLDLDGADALDLVTSTYDGFGIWNPTCTPCPGDVDRNGEIDILDLFVVLAEWGPCVDCPGDVDKSGHVGQPDLLQILSGWGACP